MLILLVILLNLLCVTSLCFFAFCIGYQRGREITRKNHARAEWERRARSAVERLFRRAEMFEDCGEIAAAKMARAQAEYADQQLKKILSANASK